jgi:nitrite reductase/ring-hydroxylating ferredoxin subunit/uncharacterized membrane protein
MDPRQSLVDVSKTVMDSEGLETAADRLAGGVNDLYGAAGAPGQAVADVLHGTWMGHPLHPALVAVPIGAWTVAQVLDALEAATGSREYAAGADTAVAVGIAGALVSAAAGLTDWKDTAGEPRRLGLVHGLINTVALSLFAGSLAARRNDDRTTGRWLGALGYAAVMAGGYLGGHLAFHHKIGMDHSDHAEDIAPRFTAVLREADLDEGKPTRVELHGAPLVLVKRRGRIHAMSERCAHQGGPLSEGKLDGDSLVCPWHGSTFALEDGRVLRGPSTFDQPCFATRVRDGWIEVKAASLAGRPEPVEPAEPEPRTAPRPKRSGAAKPGHRPRA